MRLKKNFNKLTRKERLLIYDKLVKKHGENCMICGAERQTRRLHIDHDHRDKKLVRGLLCMGCNRGLSWFRDKPDRLRSAANYLEISK